ncbi:MAG: metallophosphoesterase family protein [Acidimicrobiia bacterium]
MRYWTADLHFGHANILGYCDRPFADLAAMHEGLIERWNDAVGADDEVWVLGDVAMGRFDESIALVKRLRGRKVLVAGNHDRCWAGHGDRAVGYGDVYRAAGFERIVQTATKIDVAGTSVVVSHFPYRGDTQPVDRYVEHRADDTGLVILHGHVHGNWQVNGRQINVGVDVRDYAPVSEDMLAREIAAAV